MIASATAVGIAAIGVGGLLPARWATRDHVRWALLVLPAGMIVCAVATSLTLMLPGPFALWWLVAATVAAGISLSGSRADAPSAPRLPAAAVLVAAAAALFELRPASAGWDARSIWFLHARLIAAGHRELLAGLTDPVLQFSHPDYPPAASGAVALAWVTGSSGDLRVAQILIGLITAMATAAFGFELARMGRGARGLTLSAVTGATIVFACYGCFGSYASNGYVDPLWAVLAAGAVVAGLIAPIEEPSRRSALILAAAAALTKNDGGPIAIGIIVLTVLRYRMAGRSEDGPAVLRPGKDLCAPILLAVPLALWQVAIHLHGIANRLDLTDGLHGLVTDPAERSRFAPFWTALWSHFPLSIWVGLSVVLGAAIWRRQRQQVGLGDQAWSILVLVLVLVLELPALAAAYLFDPAPLGGLIASSIDRTTIVLNVLALALLASWPIAIARSLDSPTVSSSRNSPVVHDPAEPEPVR